MIAPMQIDRHHMTLPAGVPEWVHLCPAGTFTGVDGRGPYTVPDPAALVRNSMAGGRKLPIDENHSTDLAGVVGGPAPARGWIVAMEARDDGIWGKVEWTPTGTTLMTERAYSGISPSWPRTPNGKVTQILRASLTNAPNLTLNTLNHQETRMDLVQLRAALGLSDTADEAAIMAAINAGRQAVVTHAAQIAALATAAGLDAALPVDRLVVELQSQRGDASRIGQMAATIVELQTQVATMRTDGARTAATAFIDAAIKAGKPIVALRDHYIDQHTRDAARVETEINAMMSINGGAVVLNASNPGGNGLTPTDRTVAALMGVDPVKLAEFKAKQASSHDGRAA